MENNNYGIREIIDLFVFDKEGKLITVLDTLNESKIVSSEEGDYILVKNGLLNIDLLRFQQNSCNKLEDDFKTVLSQIKGVPVVVNKKNRKKECKLIAKSIIRSHATFEDEYIYYEIPIAEITNKYEMKTKGGEPSSFDILFEILPDENGDLFTIHGLK